MGRVTVIKNNSIDINLITDFQDNGWSVVNGEAVHDACNEGSFVYRNFLTQEGFKYTIRYSLSGMGNGSFQLTIGGVPGQVRSANGEYVEEIIVNQVGNLSFWSDANVVLSDLVITSGEVAYKTIVFNNDGSQWVGYRSYTSDFMTKFIDDFYSFKNGELWKHNVNDLRNNFYGVQYPSIITFLVNVNPTAVKTLSSIRINGNKPWNITEVIIEPREGKHRGQRSRIKHGNFRNLQGQYFADFLKDMNDPRFSNELEALMKGADLQGQVAKITMEINTDQPVKLVSVDILESVQQYSY